jgi:hypothetical protein
MIKVQREAKPGRAVLRGAWPVRGVAAATILYSVGIAVSPKLLAKPCGLTDSDDLVPADAAGLIRAIGTRDAVLSTLLFLSPAGGYMHALTGARALCDATDSIWFYGFVPKRQRPKLLAVALGWAALELAVNAGFNNSGSAD